MDRYQEMSSFVAVVDTTSFVAAARATGLSKAAISRHVSDLEKRLGVRLLQRTTRRLSLTVEGEQFLVRCRDALSIVAEAESELNSHSVEPSGLVRITAPMSFGVLHLAHLWGRFMERYPKVSLDVALNDRVVDMVEEGYDLAVRIGPPRESNLIGRKLSSRRSLVCASPDYLARHPAPQHPHELAAHPIMAYSYWPSRDEWPFEGPDGPVVARVSPRLRSNNGDTCRIAVLHHQGITMQPDFIVGPDIKSGALVHLMPQYRLPEIGIYVVYPTRKYLPLKVRRLVDFLAEVLPQHLRDSIGESSA
jgi:DNA-binding transcriptional LysR family regulator